MSIKYHSCTIGADDKDVIVGLFLEGQEDSCSPQGEIRIPKGEIERFCSFLRAYAKPFPIIIDGEPVTLVQH